MLVREVMTSRAVTIRAGASIKEAITILDTHEITALPVVSGGGKVVGVVSEADLIRELVAHDPRLHEMPMGDVIARPRVVEEVMTPHAVTVRPDTDLADAIELMTSTTVKSLPVVDAKDRLVGMISRRDVVRLLARADSRLGVEVDTLLRSMGLTDWLVDVHDGVATLTGPAGPDCLMAEIAARSVPGVLAVHVSS